MKTIFTRTNSAKAILAAGALALAAAGLTGCATNAEKETYYASLTVQDPDLSAIVDGSYRGSFALKPPAGIYVANSSVEVEVSVVDHLYRGITVLTKSVAGWPSLAKLRDLIRERQTLQVDGLSGATSLTGKAYLKAVENALTARR